MQLTSRERIMRTLRREPVDRVPISTYELVGYNWDAWENKAPSYKSLMDRIRLDTDCFYMWDCDVFADSGLWDRRRETLADGTVLTYSRLKTPKGDLTRTHKTIPDIHTDWETEHLLKSVEDIDKYLSVLPELFKIDDKKVAAAMESHAIALERVGDNGIIMVSSGDPSAFVPPLFEFGLFTMLCYEQHDMILELIDAHTRPVLDRYRVDAENGFGTLNRICGPEYFGAPYLPIEFFREMVVPGCAEAIRILKEGGIHARFHAHGRVREFLPHVVEMGATAIDPLEPPPDGDMPLGEVKRLYGDSLVLFGNTELKVLETAEPEDVDALVRGQMADAKQGGGYVLCTTAAPINEPLSERTERNYHAWIDAGLKYGAY